MPPEHKNNTDMRKDYQKLDEISFQRLSHAELCSLMNLLAGCMEQTGAEALHIEAQEIMEIKELTALLTDGMTEPTACAETPQIQQLVADQRKLMTTLRDTCRSLTRMPYAGMSEAAKRLYPVFPPHTDFHKLPQIQLLEVVSAVLLDLGKEENAPLVEQLTLQTHVDELAELNRRTRRLVDSRTRNRSARRTIDTQDVRERLCRSYTNLSTYIWAQSIVQPSPQLDKFIAHANAFIAEARHSLNRRIAKRKKKGTKGTGEA